jgi:hypothetical protein
MIEDELKNEEALEELGETVFTEAAEEDEFDDADVLVPEIIEEVVVEEVEGEYEDDIDFLGAGNKDEIY